MIELLKQRQKSKLYLWKKHRYHWLAVLFMGTYGKNWKNTGQRHKKQRFCRKFSIKFVDFFKIGIIIMFCMDTQNYVKIASYALLANLRNRKVVVGAKQLRKALQKGVAAQVFLAENADPALTQPIIELCVSCGAECFWVRTMSELGSACGIDVGAAAAAVVG